MKYRLEFEIEGLPKITTNANSNWRTRWAQARRWKDLVRQRIDFKSKPQSPILRARVICTRFAHGARPDSDNLRSSFKHVIDGLVEVGVLANDDFNSIGEPIVLWEKAKPKQGKIKIIVEEL
jgi:hypothetical protein